MQQVKLHPAAKVEIGESENFYWLRGGGSLSDSFMAEMREAYRTILESPERWAIHTAGARRYLTNRFHYALFYYIRPEHIYVVSIASQSREPGYWLDRLNDGPFG